MRSMKRTARGLSVGLSGRGTVELEALEQRRLLSAGPDLTMVKPAGWSDKMILSTNTGDNIDAPSFSDSQNIYMDVAVGNIGTVDAPTSQLYVYVDGTLKGTLNTTALALSSNQVHSDFNIGALPAGQHIIKVTADGPDAIPELNELNNNRTRTIIVQGPVIDLTLAKPAGWSDKLVLTTGPGSTVEDGNPIYDDQNVFVDFTIINTGPSGVVPFMTQLSIDGVVAQTWTNTLPAGGQRIVLDHNIGTLSGGTHLLRLTVDGTNAVGESNELNNNRTRTITIVPRLRPDLVMALPATWSDKMIVSTEAGDILDDTTIYDDQNLFIDVAVGNIGTADAGNFATGLYMDGVLVHGFFTTSLAMGAQQITYDINIAALSAGTHTIRVTANPDGLLGELDLLNNNRTRNITVLARP